MILTFRSDGLLITEVSGAGAMESRIHGDTLTFSLQAQSNHARLRRKGDVLTMTPFAKGGQERKLMLRQWGCFGIRELDRSARECQ